MPIPLPPETRVLERMKEIAAGLDLQAVFGLSAPVTVRHYRHRNAMASEKPGLALRLVETEINAEAAGYHTAFETCWAMKVELIVDLSLLPEAVDTLAAAGDDNDATGWDRLLGVGRYVAGKYVAMSSPLRLLVDDVLYGDIGPDEDSQPDEGRLAAAVIVLYRTPNEDPLHLLSPEENS